MTRQNCSWPQLKSIINSKKLPIHWGQDSNSYIVFAVDGGLSISAVIPITSPASSDQLDFENNYKASGNVIIDQMDSDGASFVRVKQCPTGWTYQVRGIEFTTANVTSLYNKDYTGTDPGDVTITFYDALGNVIADQPTADTGCVKTVLDLTPAFDYYLIGGQAKIAATPTVDVRISVVALPDIPAASGGSKMMINSINFRFIGSNDKIDADGRASKFLPKAVSGPATNKLRFIITHPAGSKNNIAIFVEFYKL